jgi:hypothetical protein
MPPVSWKACFLLLAIALICVWIGATIMVDQISD